MSSKSPFSAKRLLVALSLLAVGLFAIYSVAGWQAAAVTYLVLAALATPMPSARLGSNSLGTLSGTQIIQRALEMTFTERPELGMISMGFADLDGKVNQLNLNQSATSRLRSTPVVGDFGDAAQGLTDTDVTVTLDGFKQLLVTFTPQESNATDRNLIDEAAEPIALAIGNYIIDATSGLWTSRNFSRSITVASDWNYDNTLRPIRKDLQEAGVPKGKRFLVSNSDVYDSFLGDSMIVTALNNPANANAIASGQVPNTLGLRLGEYTDLSDNNSIVLTTVATAYVANTFTKATHGLLDGDRIKLSAIVDTTGIDGNTIYYVRDATTNTFKIALTDGGDAVDLLTSDGTATVTLQENLLGFAGAPDSTVYVARPPKNPEELLPGAKFPGLIGYVQDPKTKFTIMVNQWIGTDLKINTRMLWLEGRAKGNSNNGVRLISA